MREPSTVKQAFVCGHPIAHSRSPMIHGNWLRRYHINGTYKAINVKPDDFALFLKRIRTGEFIGGNATIPHKELAFKLADHTEEAANIIGAVNTLWMEDGKLNASNTDAYGFASNLDERAGGWDNTKTALIIGAGGASRAIIYALLQRNFTDIRIANRTVARARELADRFGARTSAHDLAAINELSADAGLIVNTTSLGMKGEGDIALDFARVSPNALITDIVYVPLMTPFLTGAHQAGLKTIDGLGMLLHQAVPGFEKWFGVTPQVTAELRDLIIADMAKPK